MVSPHLMHHALPGVRTTSRRAPSASVPDVTALKQKSSASGVAQDRAPTCSQTVFTRSNPWAFACSRRMLSTLSQSATSCTPSLHGDFAALFFSPHYFRLTRLPARSAGRIAERYSPRRPLVHLPDRPFTIWKKVYLNSAKPLFTIFQRLLRADPGNRRRTLAAAEPPPRTAAR